jgi:hypothetical protein
MNAAADQIRSLIAEGKLKIRCANMAEGDDSTFLVHNLQEENGAFVLSSNDFLCHPIEAR